MPYLRIGVVTIDESTVGFEGDEVRLVIGEPAEAFGNVGGSGLRDGVMRALRIMEVVR